MRFFKNGLDQGLAYSGSAEIPIGVYFPAISLFGTARITVNFGPSFILKHDIYGANGCSEAQPMSPDDRKVSTLRPPHASLLSFRRRSTRFVSPKSESGLSQGREQQLRLNNGSCEFVNRIDSPPSARATSCSVPPENSSRVAKAGRKICGNKGTMSLKYRPVQ
jgi:hypothetical protein